VNISLHALDVGFDLRLHGAVRLALPLKGRHEVTHHLAGDCLRSVCSEGTLIEIAESLASSGYDVVPFCTKNGRDVRCFAGPPSRRWAVQQKNDNYWHKAETCAATLAAAGWTDADLIPTSAVYL
jgi:hypothetical protein